MESIEWLTELAHGGRVRKQIRNSAREALEESDLSRVLELAGSLGRNGEASAALKSILAERITEYTIKAMKEAKKRGTTVGAASIIIASRTK